VDYSDSEAVDFIRGYVTKMFPTEVERIMPLCLLDFAKPLCFHHLDSWLEALDVSLDDSVLADLRAGYVFISAYYFLLDSVCDSHLDSPNDALYLSHLLTGTYVLWYQACLRAVPEKVERLKDMLLCHVSRNASAVQLETKLHESPLDIAPSEDYISCIGRSDSALLLYDVLCMFCDRETDPDLISLLSDAVYYIQLGDDVADWRKDYRARRWTSLLREVFSQTGTIVSERECEDRIYLDGLLERRYAVMVNGYRRLLRCLREASYHTNLLRKWIQHEHDKALSCLSDAVTVKLSLLGVDEIE